MAEYIEREAFLNYMKGTSRYFDVKFDIENFPVADVAPVVHGRWISIPEYENKRCSVCRTVFSEFTLGHYYPHCGARMDGDNDATD